jgi:hypothetical protein
MTQLLQNSSGQVAVSSLGKPWGFLDLLHGTTERRLTSRMFSWWRIFPPCITSMGSWATSTMSAVLPVSRVDLYGLFTAAFLPAIPGVIGSVPFDVVAQAAVKLLF